MQRNLFSLELEPAVESRPHRAQRLVTAEIREREERTREVTTQERDNLAFRRRAFMVFSGELLVDVFDPADGATLDSVLAELVGRFNGGATSFWTLRELVVWKGELVAAVVTTGKDRRARVTRLAIAVARA